MPYTFIWIHWYLLCTVFCHLHPCGLRAGPTSLPVVIHDMEELLLLFILCQWHTVGLLLHQSNGSLSRVIHNCHGWCCHPEVLVGRIITSFFRVLRKEALHLLFFIQLQNVKDDSSPVLSVKEEIRPAELRDSGRQTRRFTKLVDCGRQRFVTICDFTSTPTMSSNNDRQAKIS